MFFPELKGYLKKNIGDCILYFDRKFPDSIIAVEGIKLDGIKQKTLTYILHDMDTRQYVLSVQFEGVRTVNTMLTPLSDIFVIPNIMKVPDTELIMKRDKKEKRIAIPKIIYQVTNYGILDDPEYKDCNFSDSLIKVFVENSAAEVYKTSMTVGEDVICGDGNPWGKIKGAYQFKSPLIIRRGGTIIIQK